jgi:serine/threonine protein kinase
MCFDLAHGGDFLGFINTRLAMQQDNGVENEACDVNTTTFYISEIIEAIEYLHGFDPPIIHRDLKPESDI